MHLLADIPNPHKNASRFAPNDDGRSRLLSRARSTLWRLGWFGRSGADEPRQIAGAEAYDYRAVLDVRPRGLTLRDNHILRFGSDVARPSKTWVAHDVLMLRHTGALAAPVVGPLNDAMVGGWSALPTGLVEADARSVGSLLRPDPREIERVAGRCAPFCHYGQATFGHFVLDGLLQVFLNHAALLAGDVRLVHWPLAHGWMNAGLEAVGLRTAHRRELRSGAARFEIAHLSSALAGHGVYFPASFSRAFFAWLGGILNVDQGPHHGRRLYIRRAEHSSRRIGNLGDLENLLISYGFSIVSPENYTLSEQASFFRFANTVVSPWGSGLALAPFLGRGGRIIELLPECVDDIWFLRQAAVHGLDYTPIVHNSSADGGIVADLSVIDEVLRELPD